ncbi:hypothetical protein [Kingella oralis]|nr:hypothetical protein [Kingella oralis]
MFSHPRQPENQNECNSTIHPLFQAAYIQQSSLKQPFHYFQ